MYRSLLLLLITCSSVISVMGQNLGSGYIGKRFIIHGSFQARYSLNNPTKDGSSGFLSFNKQFGLGFEFALNNKTSIIASYHSFNTLKTDTKQVFDYPTFTFYDNILETQLGVRSLTVEFRRYRKNLAPIGLFTGFLLNRKIADITRDQSITSSYLITPPIERISLFSVGLSIGMQRIFLDQIAVSVGANFLVPVELHKIGLIKKEDNIHKRYEDFHRRIMMHDIANLKVSVGYIF